MQGRAVYSGINMKIPLCDTSQLNTSRGIELELQNETLSLFLVKDKDHIRAYKNQCPHTGIELNWLPDQFLDRDGDYIQCATHGARFRLEDGLCISGPCAGQGLIPLVLSIDANQIYLDYPDQE